MNHEIIDVYTVEQERNRRITWFVIIGIVVLSILTTFAAAAGYINSDMTFRVVMFCGGASFLILKYLHFSGERGLSPAGRVIAAIGVAGMLLMAFGSLKFQIAGAVICGAVWLLMRLAQKGRGFHA